jgi:hypothetical protein
MKQFKLQVAQLLIGLGKSSRVRRKKFLWGIIDTMPHKNFIIRKILKYPNIMIFIEREVLSIEHCFSTKNKS